jgi:hypothetical protein
MTLGEKLTVLVAAGSLLTGLGSLVVSWQSFQASKDAKELRQAVQGIAELAKETKRQADGQAAHLAVLQDQARQAGLQTSAISAQTTAIKDSSVAAIASARAQTEAAEVATVAQRPNIALTEINITGMGNDPDKDNLVPITVTWVFTNVGGSPIVHKPSMLKIYFTIDGSVGGGAIYDMPFGGNDWVVTPNSGFKPVDPMNIRVLKQVADDAKAGKLTAVFFGEVNYLDNRGAIHKHCVSFFVPLKDAGGTKFSPTTIPWAPCRTS